MISGKNSLKDILIKPMHRFAKLITTTNSKVQEPNTYNQAINDLIYENR